MRPDLDERLLRGSRNVRPDPDPAAVRRGIALLLAEGERAARRRRRPVVAGGVLAAVLVTAIAAVAADRLSEREPAAALATTATVDRTFSCRVTGGFPVRVEAGPARRMVLGGQVVTPPASLAAGTAVSSTTWPFAVVRAEFFAAAGWRGFSLPRGPGVFADPARCVPATARVPLSQTGLPGPAVRYEKAVACSVSGRVLVRVRATLAGPAAWSRLDATYAGAQRRVLAASLAVRDQRSGAPLAFGRLQGRETTLWYSGRCS